MKGGPLVLGFGNLRNEAVDIVIDVRRKFSEFVINSKKQQTLMKGNWGGKDTTPIQCPSWAILSLDHMGSTDNRALQLICEDYGLGCYSVLMANGISGP